MGLRINTNVAALAAQNRLQKTTKKLETALERLSTGLRINKGSDDVVGLLKSESLRSQIRGIGVAQLNISNGGSLLGVAEGALAQLTDIAQQVREKVLQAADDTISAADRTNITSSVSDLLSEYSRLTAATEFDGVKLLSGTFTNKLFQVGPRGGDSLSISITDTRSPVIGQIAVLTSTVASSLSTTSAATLADADGMTINGVALGTSGFANDGVSSYEASDSAIAYVNAINSISGSSGVQAIVQKNVVTLTYSNTNEMSTTDVLLINGVTIDHTASVITATDASIITLVSAINAKTTSTGVVATQDTINDTISLTATDGRNIMYKLNSSALSVSTTGILGFAGSGGSASAFAIYRGTFKLFKDAAFVVQNASAELNSASATVGAALNTSLALNGLSVSTSDNATDGLFILDNVIRQLQSRRADVGSKSNRFDTARAELDSRLENFSAAESRIRDADVAQETAQLTAQQILQQAGVTVLARANAIPQIALTLLQGQ